MSDRIELPEGLPEAIAQAGQDAALPGDGSELVFNSPWEAKAFAIVLALQQQGHYSWTEWAQALGGEIRAAGDEDDGTGYYLLWLSAAEKLIASKALVDESELLARKQALEVAQGGPA